MPACENDTLTIFAITSSLNITEFRFQQRTQSNNIWTNISGTVAVAADSNKVVGTNTSFTSLDITRTLKFSSTQAAKIAFIEKGDSIKKSIEEFHKVQSAIFRHKAGVLKNAKVQNKLREIIELAPNHLSAKLALQVATGKTPRTLSLQGSLEKTENSASILIQAARSGSNPSDSLGTDDLAQAISELKRMRLKLDKRVWSYADSIQDFGKLVREFKASPPRGNTSKRKKLNEIQKRNYSCRW